MLEGIRAMKKLSVTAMSLLAMTACASPENTNAFQGTIPVNGGGAGGSEVVAVNGTGGMAPVAIGSTPLPCDVQTVLATKCWGCHGAQTNYAAPMSLTKDEDVHKMTRDGAEQIYQRMSKRIHDTSASMPPKGFAALTKSELTTLDAWIAQSAPGGSGMCAPPSTGIGGTSGDAGPSTSTAGSGPTAVTPTQFPDGGSTKPAPEDVPVEPDASECDMVSFHARSDANDTKFAVPPGEQYYCFGFHKDWGAGTQGLAFYPNIDNKQVIHHWLLYKMVSPQINGTNNICIGLHRDGEQLAGWAPGAGPAFMPKHVGLDLGTGDYLLEVHYTNTGAPTQDGSGVTVCKAKTPRPDTATLSWLGTEIIALPPMANTLNVVSGCRPNVTADKPIHIIRSWPHMHKLGRHMKADIHRADGKIDPLFNVDFDFNSQWGYDTPAILNPGDWIETTCTYDNQTPNLVTFGESTSTEMCYNFTYAYPANSLVTFGLHSTACDN